MKGESSIITAKKTIEFLKSSFTPYNSLDLVLKLSALRLLPQNAEKTVRLDLLLHTASSLLNFRAPRITDNKMRTIINHKFVSESFFRFQEDPGTNIFCEELSFYGGGYRVFPGINSSIIYQLKNTFYALFQNNKQLLPQENLEEIEKLIMFVLSISEAIADRSGIERYVDTIYTKDIYMPSQKQLFELGLCNLFKENELNQLGEEIKLPFSIL